MNQIPIKNLPVKVNEFWDVGPEIVEQFLDDSDDNDDQQNDDENDDNAENNDNPDGKQESVN